MGAMASVPKKRSPTHKPATRETARDRRWCAAGSTSPPRHSRATPTPGPSAMWMRQTSSLFGLAGPSCERPPGRTTERAPPMRLRRKVSCSKRGECVRPQQQEGDDGGLGDEHGARSARRAVRRRTTAARARSWWRWSPATGASANARSRADWKRSSLFFSRQRQHDGGCRRRQPGIDGARIGWIVLQDTAVIVCTEVWTVKGPRAGEHLVEHRAEREDVGAVIHRRAEDLLGRHVAGRAADLSGARLVDRLRLDSARVSCSLSLATPEIQQLQPPVCW